MLPKTVLSRHALLALALAVTQVPVFAQPTPTLAPQTAADTMFGPITLRDESIDQVLAIVERLTGKTVLRPQTMPTAAITFTLRESVTKAEAIQAVETLLNLHGIAITPLGTRFLKVIPLNLAKSEAPEFIDGSTLELTPSGRIASKLFQPTFLRISEFMPQVAGLLNPAAGAVPVLFEKNNSALITDSVSNLQRVESLIARLDQPLLTGLQPKFYPLNYAKASEVVNRIRALFTGPLQSQIGNATTINADERTNQLIIVSDPRQVPFFDELVAKLDVQSANTRNEVLYLKHAAAKDVATILNQLVTGQNNVSKSASGDAVRQTTTTPGALAAPAPAAPAPVAAPTFSVAALGVPAESSNQFSPLLTIVPEERSNAIVVSGTVSDVRLINELVTKLDVLLAQVRIEVVIAEVTLTDKATSGISSLGLRITEGKLVGFTSAGAGYSFGDTGATFTPDTGDLTAAIGLTTTPRKNNAVILSQPNIMTTHNKEGKIFVGETRPTISGYENTGTTTGGLGGYRTSVGQQKIGIELTVKPLIGTDGSVQLEVTQVVEDVLGEVVIDGNSQPRIGNRETTSFVSARSGEIVVIGGLQRNSQTRTTNRLGPIPIIGDLFGSRVRDNTRTDLIFFLRPTVLSNTPADNVDALEQVKAFPKKQRRDVEKALDIEPTKK